MNIDTGTLGIIITVIFGIGGLCIYSKKNSVNVSIKNYNGNQDMHGVTIANEVNSTKKDDK